LQDGTNFHYITFARAQPTINPPGLLAHILTLIFSQQTLRSISLWALIATHEMVHQSPKQHIDQQGYKVLYIGGNYSSILSKLDCRFKDLEIRRGFTVSNLMTILEEAPHSLIIIEHDLLLYEDATRMIELVSLAMCDASKKAMLICSPGIDPFWWT
jgi:hypothetical protein